MTHPLMTKILLMPALQSIVPVSVVNAGKWFFSAMVAATVTTLLVILMHSLIATPSADIPEVPEYVVVDPVLIEPKIETRKEIPKPEEPAAVELPPEVPTLTHDPIIEGGSSLVSFTPGKPTFQGSAAVSARNFPVARMMISPEYPHRAVVRGIEGYVDLRFDITQTGSTTNIQVVGAVPENIFDKAAVRAIKKWKFTPQMRDGEPVPFYGMGKRLVFNLEK